MMSTDSIFATLNVQPSSSDRPIISLFRALRAPVLITAITLVPAIVCAQADFEKGYQAFQSYHGSDFDTVNLANGNLVLNIPLLSYEQRGGVPPVTISIRSNSTTFQSTPAITGGPLDTNQHVVASGVIGAPWGQPHVMISPGGLFWKEDRIVVSSAKTASGPEYQVRFVAIDDSGATHSLGGGVSNSTAGYIPNIKYSVDGSGLMLQPGTTATGPVLVDRKGNIGGLVDPNGNAITLKGPCATAPGSGDFFNASLPSWEGYAHGTASAKYIVDTIARGGTQIGIPNPSYLPPMESYSCLVDIDASYHETIKVSNETSPPQYSSGSPYICPTVQLGNSTPGSLQYYANTYFYPGENGGTVPLTFCYAETPISASIPQVNGASLEPERINENWWVLTSVELPNGTRWIFNYDTYGQVDSVIMPTGATVTYQYAWRLACGNPPGQIPVVGTPVWPYSNILSTRMVTQKNVYNNFNDISNSILPIETWTYTNNVGSGWIGAPSVQTLPSSVQTLFEYLSPNPGGVSENTTLNGPNRGNVTVTDPAGDTTVHTFSLIGGSTCGPWETKTLYNQGSSQLLKEVDTAYTYSGTDYANPTNFSNYVSVGVFPNLVTTTLPAGSGFIYSQNQSTYDYSFGSYEDYIGQTHPFSFGQVLSSSESDWSGNYPSSLSKLSYPSPQPIQIPALRTTQHTKLWQSNWNYYARNLIDLPSLDTVLAVINGSGTQAAQTIYGYDESNGSPPGFFGNLTSVTHWLKNGTSPRTQGVYNSQGMPIQKIDAKLDVTKLAYDASGLYLSSIQHPDGSIEYPQYDDYTGLLLKNIDVNGQPTSYSYDPMRRLIGVNYPDNGWETLVYNDSPPNLSVTFTKAITSTNALVKKALADGLGRLTQTQLLSDPYRPVYTITTYDSLGRVASVSNPYRSNSEATYGVTSYTYDALSRKTIITAPDGTKKQVCFNGINTVSQSNCKPNVLSIVGAWEDDADENGNDWQRTQNALGQMTYVAEPSGTSNLPSMETDYTYDVLNNLLLVNQKGGLNDASGARAPRVFAYDSLSRLLTSLNPETGNSTYTYDLNGNVLTKTDARSITTSYAYDSMNRLYCKSYSGDVSSTPSSWYQYGTSQQLGFVGRLINAWTQSASAGACTATPVAAPTSGFMAMRSIQGYDPMGRILNEQQNTLATQAEGTPYSLAYTYDLAGDLQSSTNGVGPTPTAAPFIFTNTFDGAGRLQTVASNWTTNYVNNTPSVFPATLFSAQTGSATCPNSVSPQAAYAAFGGLANAMLGNGLTLNRAYDNRLRTTCENDAGSSITAATSGSVAVTISGTEQSK